MKALLRVVLQRQIKQGMVAKWQAFLLLYHLAKEFAIVSIARKLYGKVFTEFIENNFIEIFKSSCNPAGNVFVQDGDPSKNSKAAKTAVDKFGTVQFSISPHSMDLNPIENAFKLVEKKLSIDPVKYFISKESYAKFVERVQDKLFGSINLLIILSSPC